MGIGLLYSNGYFRQSLLADGTQLECYPPNDPYQLPITPLKDVHGMPLRIEVAFPGRSVFVRAWNVVVGRVQLLLLDSNDAANSAADRGITTRLYGGGEELRLQQEFLLGIGGWTLISTLKLQPDVCHLNEGHAAFAILERASDLMTQTHCTFDVALRATRIGTLFTTHTPVAAAFDRYAPALMMKYFSAYIARLGISEAEFLALGRLNHTADEPFCMAYLAVRGSGRVNAVSQLHAVVSRELFQPLFPGCPSTDVPIGFVTNGVHAPSWDSIAADRLWSEACGVGRWRGDLLAMAQKLACIPLAKLWAMRENNRERLIDIARTRLVYALTVANASVERIEAAQTTLSPHILTIGFARRFTDYKRPTLLLTDPDRLVRLLTDVSRPIQLIIAGKAHPEDAEGKKMIQDWVQFAERADVRHRVVFIADYDLLVAEELVQGADLWLNTPRRPWEASGTSGMKTLVNGGLNLSELDGWWAEAYAPGLGWALGDGNIHTNTAEWDHQEAQRLYELLEHEVIPCFYDRQRDQIPVAWTTMMSASMAQLTPKFSANRMVRQYTEEYYLPAAAAYLQRTSGANASAVYLERVLDALAQHWHDIRFGAMKNTVLGDRRRVTLEVVLNDIPAKDVKIELYANACGDYGRECIEMQKTSNGPPAVYAAELPALRPAGDYTARVVPAEADLALPLESQLIAWQR